MKRTTVAAALLALTLPVLADAQSATGKSRRQRLPHPDHRLARDLRPDGHRRGAGRPLPSRHAPREARAARQEVHRQGAREGADDELPAQSDTAGGGGSSKNGSGTGAARKGASVPAHRRDRVHQRRCGRARRTVTAGSGTEVYSFRAPRCSAERERKSSAIAPEGQAERLRVPLANCA